MHRRERDVQAEYNQRLGGRREVICRGGKIDILDDRRRRIIEVKEWTAWMSGLGQLMSYGKDYPGFKKELHLFRAEWSTNVTPEKLEHILSVCGVTDVDVTLDESVGLELTRKPPPAWKRLLCLACRGPRVAAA